MGWLKILSGDKKEQYFWDSDPSEEARIAREKFEHYLSQGFIACKIMDNGKVGVQTTKFDSKAEEIFMFGILDGG